MKTLLAFCLTTLAISAPRAADAPAAITLKHKSSFEAADARNPFWPIGWTRPDPSKAGATEVAPALSAASFSLTSVTMGTGPHFAILNGKVLQEGQQFGLQFGSQIYQVTVQAIEDGQVVLSYQGGQVVVPLRRR